MRLILLLFPVAKVQNLKAIHNQSTTNNKEKSDNKIKTDNKYEKLRELKSLFDDGVITQEEFDVEKNKLLDKK